MASDTPLGVGSAYQSLHADGGSGPFSETQPGELIRAPGDENDVNGNLVVNWGLVDIDESNGPVEIAPRSHRYPPAQAHQMIIEGKMPLLRCVLRKGDLLIRDFRTLHRGTPNVTGTPRPHMTITFSPTAEIAAEKSNICPGIQREVYDALSSQGQRILRAVTRVEGPPHADVAMNGYEMY